MNEQEMRAIPSGRVVDITYRCRDIGYGVEEGVSFGYFTPEIDWTGKRTFIEDDQATTTSEGKLFLFPDEILSVEEVYPA